MRRQLLIQSSQRFQCTAVRSTSNTSTSILSRKRWLRMDPVMKWTLLVDLGRRVPFLLHSTIKINDKEAPDNNKSLPASFNSEDQEHHSVLLRDLSYSVRLKLALSCLLWIRSLKDIQDTLARLRLPYTPISRFEDSPIATVFPCRWQEYWIDINSVVQVKMNTALNNTAEQVPAPHTWNPETAITIEDSETESTIALEYTTSHGLKGQRDSQAKLLDRVQGTVARPSDDDALAEKLTSRKKRRRLLAHGGGGLVRYSEWAHSTGKKVLKDWERKVDPPTLWEENKEDEKYHGNESRAEGCPVTEKGTAPATPIHIEVGEKEAESEEHLLRYCVMSHAAILSSLYIEGRTVQFSSNNPTVLAYVRWLFRDTEREGYLGTQCTSTAEDSTLRPFYPPWTKGPHNMVLLPPRHQCFTAGEIQQLAHLIVRSSPCAVWTEGREEASVYLDPIRSEVDRILKKYNLPSQSVSWIAVGRRYYNTGPLDPSHMADPITEEKQGDQSGFVPRVGSSPDRPSDWLTSVVQKVSSAGKGNGGTEIPFLENFLDDVAKASEQFYSMELLSLPTNCALHRRALNSFLWKQLPSNVRLVGINTSPQDVLYFFPQAVFLTMKVGNAFRFRAVDRSVVQKYSVNTLRGHPLRALSAWWGTLRYPVDCLGLNSSLSLADRSLLKKDQKKTQSDSEDSTDALFAERSIEYLSDPNKGSLIGMMSAKLFGI